MDLSVIGLKIERQKYKSIEDFDRDVRLMTRNTLVVYGPDTQEHWVSPPPSCLTCVLGLILCGRPDIQIAEILQYAWHLIYQNIQSVLQDDPSLEVHLPEGHTTTVESTTETAAELEPEEPTKDGRSRNNRRTKFDSDGEDADFNYSEEVAARAQERQREKKERKPSVRPAAAVKSEAKRVIPRASFAKAPEEPEIKAYSSLVVDPPHDFLPDKLPADAVLSRQEYYLLRLAVERRPVMVDGRIVVNGVLVDGKVVMPLRDLPTVPADGQLRWALTILRDSPVQALLRKHFAARLVELLNASADLNTTTVDGLAESVNEGKFASKVALPAMDHMSRMLFQLGQVSMTNEHRIDPLDEYVLRVYIPLVVYHVMQFVAAEGGGNGSAPGSQGATSATGGAGARTGPAGATAAGGAAAHAKYLATSAKQVLQSVFEQHPTAAITTRAEVNTCFSDPRTLRDFLDGITRHLINMKGQFFKKGGLGLAGQTVSRP